MVFQFFVRDQVKTPQLTAKNDDTPHIQNTKAEVETFELNMLKPSLGSFHACPLQKPGCVTTLRH